METNYFEVFNRDNVELVDISETPIDRITKTGIQTTDRHFDLDIIVYATGFDAITGGYDRIDIQGVGGAKLAEKWKDGPSTFLGLTVHGYPNLLMLAGPQSNSASVNYPRSIEICGHWITSLLEHVRDRGVTRFEATAEAEQQWTDHVRVTALCPGPVPSEFQARAGLEPGFDSAVLNVSPSEVASAGYRGFELS